ncbi:MAG TPA: T9SS type A sorting domain-containing protein [Bacteroidales bacterium]|nr:T9SS type A sorting domain-containing protein [Bacteroidales bacterium]
MKKLLLCLFSLLALTTVIRAQQVIEDFELLTLNQLSNEPLPNDSLIIVDNPAPNDLNSSTRVLKFRRSKDGAVWAGFWSRLDQAVDLTTMKYFSVDVLKPRISTVKFKVEGGTSTPTFFELPSLSEPTKTDEWERLVFHFPDATGEYPIIAMLLDFLDPVDLTEDDTIYVDNIVLRSAAVGGDSVVVEDFQVIPLNQLSNGDLPNDSLIIVENPVIDEVNGSSKVLKFRRSMDGDVWAGFWSTLPEPVDLTTNKYMLAKVLKTRISPIKFKIEGGTSTPAFFELPSVEEQTMTDAWEQMAFHFPDATGTYPTIAMLLDMADPVGLTEDIIIYVDDIVLSPTATGVPTGIDEPGKVDILIYPNPVKSTLNFRNLKDVDRITISNIVGQQIMVTRNISTGNISINVSSLNNGVYLVTVYDTKGNSVVRKIIKD